MFLDLTIILGFLLLEAEELKSSASALYSFVFYSLLLFVYLQHPPPSPVGLWRQWDLGVVSFWRNPLLVHSCEGS